MWSLACMCIFTAIVPHPPQGADDISGDIIVMLFTTMHDETDALFLSHYYYNKIISLFTFLMYLGKVPL
eukprot:c16084_g1_i1 orf=2-208(-)